MARGMAKHERGYCGATNEWLTPPELLRALGHFDLDPCSPVRRPWDTADHHYTIHEDGLIQPWFGRVWLNPPYGPEVGRWLARLAEHGNGMALVFARTETRTFARYVWRAAEAVLFVSGRIRFCDSTGELSSNNAGAGSVLIAYGADNARVLAQCNLPGQFLSLRLLRQKEVAL